MRILFISNFYPPARPGGYTQWCQEVADELQARGHVIAILTSNFECEKASIDEKYIFRDLFLDGDLFYYSPTQFFFQRGVQIRKNIRTVQLRLQEFSPDIVFIWGMWHLSKHIPWAAEQVCADRVVYYLCDYSPIASDFHVEYWRSPANRRVTNIFKSALRIPANLLLKFQQPPTIKYRRAICVSAAVRDILARQLPVFAQAQVIHGGTDTNHYSRSPVVHTPGKLKCLYAGQIVEHKGVHTAVEAFNRLVNHLNLKDLSLSIVGQGHPGYERQIKQMIEQYRLEEFVFFLPPVPKSDMPALLAEHAVLVFPSIYEEPLARMTQEAMLAGLVVVGTPTGGTKEILEDGVNGLIFQPGDDKLLANHIARLAKNPALRNTLAQNGRKTVLEHFCLSRMVDDIENSLLGVIREIN